MRTMFLFVVAALAGMMFFSGCGKPEQAAPDVPPPQAINGAQFVQDFTAASPEIKALADHVMMDIQGSVYPDALTTLAKLAANPALNEAQKKSASDLTDQLKKKMADLAAPPK